jgi:hypothetical protein
VGFESFGGGGGGGADELDLLVISKNKFLFLFCLLEEIFVKKEDPRQVYLTLHIPFHTAFCSKRKKDRKKDVNFFRS